MQLKKMIVLLLAAGFVLLLIPYSVPFLLAALTAVLLEPLVQFCMRTFRFSRGFASAATFILFIAVIAIGSYIIGAKLIVEGVQLAHKLPDFSAQLFEMAEEYVWLWQEYFATLPPETVSAIQQMATGLKNSAMSTASSVASAIVGGVAAIPGLLIVALLYVVSLLLIMLDLPAIRAGFMRLFTPSAREKIELVVNQLSRATVGFLYAQLILSLLTYVLSLIGLLILGVKYAVVISFLIMIVDILPILGTGSVLVPWAVYSFATNDSDLAIGLLVLYGVMTVIRRVIEPKILGSKLGISALAALASMYFGFQLVGFFGLILGPALVIIFEALRKAGFLKIKIDF